MDAELEIRLRRLETQSLLAAKDVLTLKDVAFITGRSVKTIRRRLDEMPHYRGPFGIVFKRDELIQWLCPVKCEPVQSFLSDDNYKPQ